jgi:ubiquinone/menaquinone biosynthesis C-methylase UbiE
MGGTEPQSIWKTYTPRNILNESKLRLSAFRNRKTERLQPRMPYDARHARNVGDFYDRHHEKFLRVYGDVIQAFRTRDVKDLLNYQIASIGLRAGQRVLDAGCGIAAPAIHFARHAQVSVDAITISATQFEAARERVANANLSATVRLFCGDYHHLSDHFPPAAYDVVYFLESFGHSRSKARLLQECWRVLKPGGLLYVKDLFRRIPLKPQHAAAIDREIRKINAAYCYDVADLNAVLDQVRAQGYILASLKTIDLDLEQFEDLAISNEFQELTGIALIENWGEYIFPVDFFELKCIKPEFNLEERLDRHFLQQRYHLQQTR